jgi:hypothetical protein
VERFWQQDEYLYEALVDRFSACRNFSFSASSERQRRGVSDSPAAAGPKEPAHKTRGASAGFLPPAGQFLSYQRCPSATLRARQLGKIRMRSIEEEVARLGNEHVWHA